MQNIEPAPLHGVLFDSTDDDVYSSCGCMRGRSWRSDPNLVVTRENARQDWGDGELRSRRPAARRKAELAQVMHKNSPRTAPNCAASAHPARCGAQSARIAERTWFPNR